MLLIIQKGATEWPGNIVQICRQKKLGHEDVRVYVSENKKTVQIPPEKQSTVANFGGQIWTVF